MRHAGTHDIETPRLLLRRLTPADAPAMYRNWANDPAVTRFLRWEPHKDENETFALLAAWPAVLTSRRACGSRATASAAPGGAKA